MKPIDSLFIFMGISFLNAQALVINEIDADSPGADTAEFIELYSSTPNLALDGYVLVLFNGADDASYAAYDLDSYSTDANGFFVIGDSGVTGVSYTFSSSSSSNIQNSAEAVALYQANKADFPIDTPVTTTNLIDAVVYDSDDSDDTGLLAGLGKTVQYNENASSDAANHSLQRQSDGSFKTGTPSPNTANAVLSIATTEISGLRIYPNPASQMLYVEGLTQTATARIYALTGQRILTKPIRHSLDVSHLTTGIYMLSLTHKGTTTTQKLIKK
jgi:hypothetical protein